MSDLENILRGLREDQCDTEALIRCIVSERDTARTERDEAWQILDMIGERLRSLGIATKATPPMSYDDAIAVWASRQRMALRKAATYIDCDACPWRDDTSRCQAVTGPCAPHLVDWLLESAANEPK